MSNELSQSANVRNYVVSVFRPVYGENVTGESTEVTVAADSANVASKAIRLNSTKGAGVEYLLPVNLTRIASYKALQATEGYDEAATDEQKEYLVAELRQTYFSNISSLLQMLLNEPKDESLSDLATVHDYVVDVRTIPGSDYCLISIRRHDYAKNTSMHFIAHRRVDSDQIQEQATNLATRPIKYMSGHWCYLTDGNGYLAVNYAALVELVSIEAVHQALCSAYLPQ